MNASGSQGAGWRRAGLAVAALLAGASGLGLEVLLLSLAGLSVGYGSAGPLGIALFVAGWAFGAAWAGRWKGRAGRVLFLAGLTVALASLLFPQLLLATAAHGTGTALAALTAAVAILSVALPQGVLLPLLARRWPAGSRIGMAGLIGANLAGAAVGAWWFGEWMPAAHGRVVAAGAAGLVALTAGLVGARSSRGEPAVAGSPDRSQQDDAGVPALDFPVAGLLLALLTGWAATIEWFGLRLGVLWLGGMQQALSAILVASLLSLALGAALGPLFLRRGVGSVLTLLIACTWFSSWPLGAPRTMEWLPKTAPTVLRALLLVGPALMCFGAAVPILHRELERPDASSLGRLLGYEALGALIGIPLSHFVLLPHFGLKGAMAAWCLFGAIGMLLLAPRLRARAVVAAAFGLVAFALVAGRLSEEPALASPPLSNPALRILAFEEDENFAVAVVEDGLLGETTLMTDGFRAAGTGESYRYMRALGHVPLLLHPAPRRVAVLAFGTGTTAGAVSLHRQVERIDVLELSRAVTDQAHWFEDVNHGVLREADQGDAPRVRLRIGDGRRTLADEPGAYDVLTMEPLLPNSPFGVYLYTREFYGRARRALAPGGILCQWVPPHALPPDVFDAVVAAFADAFPWSGLWLFGTQLVLIGAQEAPELQSERFVVEGELALDLASLGLDELDGLVARYVGDAASWPSVARPLTDADPWVVHRGSPSGKRALSMLAENLVHVRQRSSPAPPSWYLGLTPAALARVAGLEALRRAREAAEVRRVESFGVELDLDGPLRDVESELAEAARLAPDDPELRAFLRQVTYERARREGFAALLVDPSVEGGRRALPLLLRAAELAPERADVHLYVAVALERAGEVDAARAALRRARELCPRISETSAADQARVFGFPGTQELAFEF